MNIKVLTVMFTSITELIKVQFIFGFILSRFSLFLVPVRLLTRNEIPIIPVTAFPQSVCHNLLGKNQKVEAFDSIFS